MFSHIHFQKGKTMTDATQATLETETDAPAEAAAPAAAATETKELTKVQRERALHGPESAAQLIGHLGRPKADVSQAIYVEPRQRDDKTMTHGHIWGTLAVNRGENFDPSWVFYNIYPVANEAGERPSPEQMKALAEELRTGRRVKMQGPIEVRQGATHEVIVDGQPRNIRDTSVTIKLFWDGSACPTDAGVSNDSNDSRNAAGGRPLTFLPRIGEDKAGPDVGF